MRIFIFIIFLFGCTHDKSYPNDTIQYKLFSTSTLRFHLTSDALDTLYVEATSARNIPRQGSETRLMPILKKGIYYLELIIDRPHAATLHINNETYNVLVVPEDTTQIRITPEGNSIGLAFEGGNSEVNNYYLSKKMDLGYTDIRFPINQRLSSLPTYSSLKRNVDSITNKELQYLKNYTLKNELPNWFYQYETSEIIYTGAGFKTGLPYANAQFFHDTLPTNYYDFLKEIKINNTEALLSSRYFWYLDDYFMRDLPYERFEQLSGYSRIQTINGHILRKSMNVLTAEIKDIYYKYLLSSQLQYLTDSIKIDSLALSYGVSDYKDLLKIKRLKSEEQFKTIILVPGEQVPDFYSTDENDSLYSIRNFKNSIVYINFWATWCGPCIKNMPALNELVSRYRKNRNVTFINICIGSEKERWKMTVKKNNLQGVNLLAEGKWGEKLKSYFQIHGIPHYVLLDKGNILFENKVEKAPYVSVKIDKLISNNDQQ